MYWDKKLAVAVCVLGALCTVGARAETPKLTLDDVDQLSQAKLVHDLTGGEAKPGSAPQPLPASAAAAPVAEAKPVRHIEPVAPVTPVNFVGAYRDEHGGSFVLYEFNGAVYPARVGEKLLNGWSTRKVDGFLVTVASGAGKGSHTWTEPIRSMTPVLTPVAPAVFAGSSLQAIRDLGSPLPPAGVGMPGPGMLQGGAQ
ncbi:MAG: hypothetical protein RXR20_00975 [Paraburkholderia sp.]|jgi:hypothetical protein|uniref:hypothetical protein n=1 Tax=Burkholderiaceae TaxID=119060 RepID=UPI0010F9C7EF|nr:hypothetical protein [Burkholderia sp. 4M9327F10]